MSGVADKTRRERLDEQRSALALRVAGLREVVDEAPEQEAQVRDALVKADLEGQSAKKVEAEKRLARTRKEADAAASEIEENLKRIAILDVALADEIQAERDAKLREARERSNEYREREREAVEKIATAFRALVDAFAAYEGACDEHAADWSASVGHADPVPHLLDVRLGSFEDVLGELYRAAFDRGNMVETSALAAFVDDLGVDSPGTHRRWRFTNGSGAPGTFSGLGPTWNGGTT